MKSLLAPLGFLYGGITESRNWLFDRQNLKSNHLPCPVISVGNITAGGTGKTPLVSSLLSWAVQQGFRAGVVSRGYKGTYVGVEKVDPTRHDSAAFYGDEPTLIAKKFLSVPVYVGAKRFEAAEKLMQLHKIDFIIADDAFQHRALARNIDIVVMDALESIENYQMLPVGRLREPLNNLKRAHYVVLSRVNLAGEKQLSAARELLVANGIKKEQIIEATTEIKGYSKLCGSLASPTPNLKVFLFSGIGNPASFQKLVSKTFTVVGTKNFRDHHPYTNDDIGQILTEARAAGADVLLTTEKDAVKIGSLVKSDDVSIFTVEIESRFSNSIEKLWNEIIRLAR